jgi:hypothetical protein
MSSTRLVIKTAEITPDGILIRSMEIIDGITGERIKPTTLTPELLEFLKCVEIDIDAYFKLQELRKKNPAVTELIQTFKLFT